MFLIDSHCHLDILNYQSLHRDVDDVLEKAANNNVKFLLSVSTTLAGYRAMREFVGNRDNVAFSCGIHPLNQNNEEYQTEELKRLASEDGVIAIGETGLDYYQSSETKLCQQESFRNHIRIGRELNKPIIIHTRNACIDTLSILKEEKIKDCGGVLHCFSEDRETAAKLLDLGIYISISGIITFRNVEKLRDVVRYIPFDHLLVETDSPYLTPVPHRGKENHPALVRCVFDYIAMIKRTTVYELAEITSRNFFNLFHVSPESLNSISTTCHV